MPSTREEFDKKYQLRCLNCSMQWGHNKLAIEGEYDKHIVFSDLTVREIRCPGCGGLSALVDEYQLYRR